MKIQTQKLSLYLILLLGIISPHSMAFAGQNVEYGQNYQGYLAVPESTKAAPAILLIHEWWGLNQDIKNKADEFARQGYVALAVNMYGKPASNDPAQARKMASAVRNNIDEAFKNLNAGIGFLKNSTMVDATRLASVGWCFGGGWSYQIAKNNLGVKASVIYYGRFNPEDDLATMRAKILGHFAEKDRGITLDAVNAFEAKLNTLDGTHQIFIYPNTQHGFANPNSKIYDQEATKKATARTLEFLKRVM